MKLMEVWNGGRTLKDYSDDPDECLTQQQKYVNGYISIQMYISMPDTDDKLLVIVNENRRTLGPDLDQRTMSYISWSSAVITLYGPVYIVKVKPTGEEASLTQDDIDFIDSQFVAHNWKML